MARWWRTKGLVQCAADVLQVLLGVWTRGVTGTWSALPGWPLAGDGAAATLPCQYGQVTEQAAGKVDDLRLDGLAELATASTVWTRSEPLWVFMSPGGLEPIAHPSALATEFAVGASR